MNHAVLGMKGLQHPMSIGAERSRDGGNERSEEEEGGDDDVEGGLAGKSGREGGSLLNIECQKCGLWQMALRQGEGLFVAIDPHDVEPQSGRRTQVPTTATPDIEQAQGTRARGQGRQSVEDEGQRGVVGTIGRGHVRTVSRLPLVGALPSR